MRAIVGVDADGSYRMAMDLFRRLDFGESRVELMHVDEWISGNYALDPMGYELLVTTNSVRQDQTERLLAAAQTEAKAANLCAGTLAGVGRPSETLSRRAEETYADLIAVGSTHKSRAGSIFLGSVGRGLALQSHNSILIAKTPVRAQGLLTVVFATNCSEYAAESLRKFVRMRPQGVGKVVVLTAVEKFTDGLPPAEVSAHVETLVQHLRDRGFRAESQIVEAGTVEAIDDAMESNAADLLVVCSRSHGFLERVLKGSISLQEVVSTPYSVLLLRNAKP